MGVDNLGSLAGSAQGAGINSRKTAALIGQPMAKLRGLFPADVSKVCVGTQVPIQVAIRLSVTNDGQF
jgi:hypothetical protein